MTLQRKSSLFAGHDVGAANSECVASLIETCKINGVDPFAYVVATLEAMTRNPPNRRLSPPGRSRHDRDYRERESALLLGEAGSDPIEDRLRETIRATVEALLFQEELAAFLGRLRYGRGGSRQGYPVLADPGHLPAAASPLSLGPMALQ
jgi:IS66 C-terminal element